MDVAAKLPVVRIARSNVPSLFRRQQTVDYGVAETVQLLGEVCPVEPGYTISG